jgi:Family of unknown function (DUF5767)
MSGLRILDDAGMSFPDVEIAQDIGNTIDIGSVDALDMGLLTNQKKLGSPSRISPVMGGGGGSGDDIEFVNLDDVGKSVSFDVKPNTSSVIQPEPIRILRGDSGTMPPAKPFTAPTPTPTTSATSAAAAAPAPSGPFGGVKSWFSSDKSTTAESSGGGGGGGGSFRSWFGGGASNNQQTAPAVVTPAVEYLTPEQEFAKKTEQLTMLERMDRKGITGNKMTMANTLEEITAEVERRKDSKALEASIRFQRSMLTTVTNGMEFLNSRFDPLGVRLDGWSEQVNENIEDYDEIFEELYDKYKDKSKVAPEVRLIMSLGLSAAMCHVTNTMFKSRMPGMDDILRNNPDLARQFAQEAAKQAVGPGFANFVGMAPNNSRRPSNTPTPRAMPQQPPIQPQQPNNGMFSGMMGMGDVGAPFEQQAPPVMTARRPMRGPTGVEDILRTLDQAGEDIPMRSVPPPASPQMMDMEEVQSVRSGFTTETARAAGRSRRKATQPVGATLSLNV